MARFLRSTPATMSHTLTSISSMIACVTELSPSDFTARAGAWRHPSHPELARRSPVSRGDRTALTRAESGQIFSPWR
jgi:hypothetical protein